MLDNPITMFLFSAPWCSQCPEFKRKLYLDIAGMKNTKLIEVDVGTNEGSLLANQYGVMGVPFVYATDKDNNVVCIGGQWNSVKSQLDKFYGRD